MNYKKINYELVGIEVLDGDFAVVHQKYVFNSFVLKVNYIQTGG